jgi:hypothetical protein
MRCRGGLLGSTASATYALGFGVRDIPRYATAHVEGPGDAITVMDAAVGWLGALLVLLLRQYARKVDSRLPISHLGVWSIS